MNKKSFLLSSTGAAIALFFACSGDVVENIETSYKAPLTLTVTVQDAVSGDLLDADISLNSGVAKTTQGGVVVFNDVATGKHHLLAKKDGYAEMLSPVEVEPVSGQNAQITRDYAATVNLYPLTSSAWGYLQYTDGNGDLRPVPKDVVVKLKLNDGDNVFVNKLYSAVTDENGKYSFDKLPMVSSYQIWVEGTTIEKNEYRSKTITAGALTAGGAAYLGQTQLVLADQTNLFTVSYSSKIQYADIALPIKFTFTEPVNRNRLTQTSIGFKPTTLDIGADASWNETNTELTLTPMGNWTGLTAITLDNVYSISGKPLNSSATDYNFTVRSKDLSKEDPIVPTLLSPVAAKIENNSLIYLKFNKVQGATGYDLYYNNNSNGIYSKATTIVVNGTENDSTVYVPFDGRTNYTFLTREVGFLVQATNADSKTPLDESKAVKVKDVVKPTFTYSNLASSGTSFTGATFYSADTTWNLSNDSLCRIHYYNSNSFVNGVAPSTYTSTVVFKEPIQVANVKVEVVNDGGTKDLSDRISVSIYWPSTTIGTGTAPTTTLAYAINIAKDPAGATPTVITSDNLKAKIVISNIKDITGNDFEVKYRYTKDAVQKTTTKNVVEIGLRGTT